MWITLRNGERKRVRKIEFSNLKEALNKQNPDEIAKSAVLVMLSSKQIMNDLAMETKAFMQQMQADSLGIGINGDKNEKNKRTPFR